MIDIIPSADANKPVYLCHYTGQTAKKNTVPALGLADRALQRVFGGSR